MQATSALPASVSFYNPTPAGAGGQGGNPTPAAPVVAAKPYVPLLPEDMNLRGMTQRALALAIGSTVDLII